MTILEIITRNKEEKQISLGWSILRRRWIPKSACRRICQQRRQKIVASVTYQNIQGSPSYNSGFAMRFPKIVHYRPDKHIKRTLNYRIFSKFSKRTLQENSIMQSSLKEIATLEDIKEEVKRMQKGRSHLG